MIDRTVWVEIGDSRVAMQPTLGAMRRINGAHGSLVEAMQRVERIDFDAICLVISAGAGHDQKQAERLAERVLENGVINVSGQAAKFLTVLMDPTDEDDEEGEPEGKP